MLNGIYTKIELKTFLKQEHDKQIALIETVYDDLIDQWENSSAPEHTKDYHIITLHQKRENAILQERRLFEGTCNAIDSAPEQQ